MLDVMRKHSRSFIIYIFFGIIIAVFVVNFGPQSAGCTAGTSHAGRVAGHPISQTLFNYIISVTGVRAKQMPEPQLVQLKGVVMDQLLERELLADGALDIGFRISDKEINDMIVKGRFLAPRCYMFQFAFCRGGQPQPLIRNDEGKFDYDLFARYVKYSWGMSVLKFQEQQRRELLAEKMRAYLRSLVKVSPQEAKTDYQVKNTQVQLSYVRFSPPDFRDRVEISEAKVKEYLSQHAATIKKHFEENKTAYQNLPQQVKLQLIQIKITDALPKAAAQKKAEAILARLKQGESFEQIAKTESADRESQRQGGLVGWRNQDSPALGDDAANKAAGQLKKDQLSEVIEGKDGYYVLKVADQRKGNLSLAQAQEDIAWDQLRSAESLRLAREEAAAFIKRAQAGEKLEEMFATEETGKPEEQKDTEQDKPAEEKTAALTDQKSSPDTAADRPPRSPLKLITTSMFPRSGMNLIPDIGVDEALTKAIFSQPKGEVLPQPFAVSQMVYLVQVKDRKDPDLKEWEKQKEELVEQYTKEKEERALRAYAYEKCQDALEKKKIYIDNSKLVTPGYVPDKNDPPLPTYLPCSSLQEGIL